jgi:hypothetical protein
MAMKRILIAFVVVACVPTLALAATTKKAPAPGPGQSEYAPGQQSGPATKSAPGQVQKRTKGKTPAKTVAPGHKG